MFAMELKVIRTKLDWTQKHLAEVVGIAPNTLAMQERGEIGISEPVARLLCLIAAGVDIEAIINPRRGRKGASHKSPKGVILLKRALQEVLRYGCAQESTCASPFPLYTTKAVARLFAVSQFTVRAWARQGLLHPRLHRISGRSVRFVFTNSDLLRFLDGGEDEVGLTLEQVDKCAEKWKAAHGVDVRDPLPDNMSSLAEDVLYRPFLRRILGAHQRGLRKKRRG